MMESQSEQLAANGQPATAHKPRFRVAACRRSVDDACAVDEPIEACLHSLVKRSAIQRPSAPAVFAWDGELTYRQLDLLSSRLAHRLVGQGLKPGAAVVLGLEKSLLAPVAALAVAKAGGASIALNFSQPQDQLRAVTAQLSDPMLLTSPANSCLARQLTSGSVLVLDDHLLSCPGSEAPGPLPELPAVSPSDALFILFADGDASGSRPPQGVAVTHRNMSSAIFYQQQALGYTADSRILDAAPQGSYVAWCNLLQTLANGGCLCIPSEHELRQDIATSIAALRADAAHLTPAMARQLGLVKQARRLQITLVGEPQVASCSVSGLTPCAGEWKSDGSDAHEMLVSLGDETCAWVAEARETGTASSFDAACELWLEGPSVGHAYSKTEVRAVPVFLKNAPRPSRVSAWSNCRGRLHRTGDVVRRAKDGSFVLLARGMDCRPVNGVAKGQARQDSEPSEDSVENLQFSSESEETLETPEAEQVDALETEQQLLTLWAQVLQLSPGKIGKDDDFFELGGDATRAMRLQRVARDRGLHFSVRDVFQNPSVRGLSAQTSLACLTLPAAVPPFSLLGSYVDEQETRAQVAQLCHVQTSQVLDVLPCSPLQEGMLALTQQQPGSYVVQQLFEIDDEISIQRLRRSWDQLVAANPILRTRIVSLPNHGVVQVVLEQGAEWRSSASHDEYQRQMSGEDHQMGLGTPLSRFAIIDGGAGGRPCFVWDIHHALYDGWSLPLMMNEAEQAYYGEASSTLEPMMGFIKYMQDRDQAAAKAFWRAQFSGIHETHFPSPKVPAVSRPAQPAAQMSLNVTGLGWGRSDYTQATMARAAWAVVMARGASSDEALYGVTVTGRQAPVAGIEHMAGPAIATVPVRVALDWESSVNNLLDAIQRQSADMIPYEQTGLQRIRRMGDEAAIACSFQSLLVVQPAEGEGDAAGRPFLSKPGGDDDQPRETASATYPIEVECQLGQDEARLRIDFDPGVVEQREMEVIATSFEHVLRQLTDRSLGQNSLGSVAPSSLMRSGRVDEALVWNAKVPEPMDECVHNLIAQRIRERPLAPALHAWDGQCTYQELDEKSTSLALQLAARGVAGTLVPILFEKSVWLPVTVLAVMKAGGAVVALEMKEPEERLRTILSQSTSPVLLTSVRNGSLARRLVAEAKDVVIVGGPEQAVASLQPEHAPAVLPAVSPSNLLYVVFTSGSTGTPKGVMISHRNFCSAIAYQRQFLDYNNNARVLDFASCAFDVSWSNLLNTLTSGACFCIPSPLDRENDLAGCLEKFDITLADLTPSVARALGSDVLSRLTTMILGGEAPLPSDASLVGKKTHVINAYGPAECTPTTTLATLDPTNVFIGRGFGACTWILEADNPDALTPVGEVGELWIEGPIVGMGYLNDPAKTEAAFFDDPAWLLRAAGRTGRVYRTGDLVRYRDDGTLVFIGRKDTQVKIRGQRVELSEVENCVRQLIEPANTQVIAEAIQPAGAGNPFLVAFVALPGAETMTEEAHAEAVQQASDGLSDRLRQTVPSYMIPAAYLPVREVPVTTAGKIDRRRLRTVGASTWSQYRNTREKKGESSKPENEMESILQQVWMSVLNLSAEEASVEAGFASLGGDSISAMQLVSRCRLHNVMFTVSDILQANTIRKLAARYRPVSSASGSKLVEEMEQQEEEDAAAEFDLSPMQQSFFNEYPEGLHHFNQSFLLDLGRDVSTDALQRAMEALVRRHAMLRARFHQDSESGTWKQRVAEEGPESFAFAEHSVTHRDEVGKAGQWRQENLDICQGPVFACDLFNMPDGNQVVLLSAHHLVIDLVSWRIVWNDVEEHIKFGELQTQKTLSFRTWCALQARVGSSLSPLAVLPYPIPDPELNFWGLPIEKNTFGDCDTFDVTLPPEPCKLLFGQSNGSLRTEALDMILGAMAHSFLRTFPERSVPSIWIEGHGREQLDDDLPTDVSGTVGWFTTMYPLVLPVSLDEPVTHAVRLAKDTRRKVPRMGLPFYACQHYSESGRKAFKGHDVYEVIFNFTGRFQQLERDEGLFKSSQTTDDTDFKICEISKSARRPCMIEIGAGVAENALTVSFNFNKGMRHQDRLQDWAQSFVEDLESAVNVLAKAPVGFTLADLPLMQLTYRGLDTMLTEQLPKMKIRPENVLNMYPCSPLQEGMLLSSVKGAASYITYTVWRCLSTGGDNSSISPSRLEEAWKMVVGRHTVLSTVFALHPEGNGFLQIVLDQPPVRVTHLSSGAESPAEMLSRLQEPSFADNEPEHALFICRSDAGEVACRLDMSHALTDAHSASLLLAELVSAYDGNQLSVAPAFSELIRYINSTPRAQIVASWTTLLDRLEPCEFPLSLPAGQEAKETFTEISCPANFTISIADFCKKTEVMPSALLQVAWAMVLSHMTGMRDVCFGYLTSGRDATVEGVENLVGPLANLLISRVDLRAPARQVLETTSERSKQHMAIQHVSLAEIQHHLGLSGRRLFNTSLSIRPAEKEKAEREQGLSFDVLAGGDAHEFDMKCNASINGNDVDLSIEFREPYVDRQVALEARAIFHQAIEYILVATDAELDVDGLAESMQKTGISPGSAETLQDGFFKHTMGVEESSATSFWRAQFANTQGTHFPPPKTASHQPELDSSVGVDFKGLDWAGANVSAATAVKAAWSVLTARIMCADESIFGAVSSEQPNLAPLPARVVVNWENTVGELLGEVQRQAVAMEPFQQMGKERIRRLNDEAVLACNFQTLLAVDSAQAASPSEATSTARVETNSVPSRYCSHAMEVRVSVEADTARIDVKFDSRVMEIARVSRIVHELDHVLRQMLDTDRRHDRLRNVTVASQKDLNDIWAWNAILPDPVEGCIHDSILQHAKGKPEAPAIHAWDGILNYRQLDELSSKLAVHLIKKGVGSGTIVPLCFEKSMWMPVAALAVMRAGGASVAVDTTQPEERIRTITTQVFTDLKGPRIILSSVTNEPLVQRLDADEVIVLSNERCNDLTYEKDYYLPVVSPSDLLYVVFTSGSTGRPKGVLIAHQNFFGAVHYQRDALGITGSSRVFDFSSYAFDVAWLSLLKTLTAGACLCIPSASEREDDLGGSLVKYGATVVDLTPSVARAVEPKSALAGLSTLILGGEAVTASDADLAGEATQVTVAYGPAECTPSSSLMDLTKTRDAGIGHGVGMCLWVVDIENPSALAPVGAVGELWLEGPLVGNGYLHEPEKTAAAFVQDPLWLTKGAPCGKQPARHGRVYRTGDLVQYREDGSLLFMGRKDTQVKIRGQRVELGDIEHHVRQAVETAGAGSVTNVQVAAETIQPRGIAGKMLVVFVALEGARGAIPAGEYNETIRQVTAGLAEPLGKVLPVFMVPSLYIPIPAIPMSATGKTDRRRLLEMGSSLTAKDVATLSRAGEQRRIPQTEAERLMQALWAEILNVEAESISADDSFFRIGGDSIGAMRLVGMARYRGFNLSVRDVFQSPILSDLAAVEGSVVS
ncbi:hypothetical protein CDD83_2187 [Cordyceps sp. RAO-2017]|nr:hypothetical protein CDD83_2187 [Cordyceps sp. RAO-2017]